MNFEVYFFTMVTSQGLGLIAVTQQIMVNPEQLWFSWPVVVVLLGLAIASTYKVTVILERMNARLNKVEGEKEESSNE